MRNLETDNVHVDIVFLFFLLLLSALQEHLLSIMVHGKISVYLTTSLFILTKAKNFNTSMLNCVLGVILGCCLMDNKNN